MVQIAQTCAQTPRLRCPVSRNAVIVSAVPILSVGSLAVHARLQKNVMSKACVSVCKTVVTESAVLTQFAKSHAARVKLGIVVIRMVSVKKMTALKSAVSAFVGPIRFVGSLAGLVRRMRNAMLKANASVCHSVASVSAG